MADFAALASKLNIGTSVQRGTNGEPEPQEEGEQLHYTCQPVSFVVADNKDAGSGVLYVTTRRLIWCSSQGQQAFVLLFPQIVCHAISRDPSSFAKPCIYLQLDEGSEDMMMAEDDEEGEGEEGEEEEEEDVPAEVRLVPDDAAKIDEVFKALCECAALNPDSDMEEEGDSNLFYNEEEVWGNLDDATRAAVLAARCEGGMELGEGEEGETGAGDLEELVGEGDPGRFEDDEEEEGGAMDVGQPTANGHA